jgi:hypothetical protein
MEGVLGWPPVAFAGGQPVGMWWLLGGLPSGFGRIQEGGGFEDDCSPLEDGEILVLELGLWA